MRSESELRSLDTRLNREGCYNHIRFTSSQRSQVGALCPSWAALVTRVQTQRPTGRHSPGEPELGTPEQDTGWSDTCCPPCTGLEPCWTLGTDRCGAPHGFYFSPSSSTSRKLKVQATSGPQMPTSVDSITAMFSIHLILLAYSLIYPTLGL